MTIFDLEADGLNPNKIHCVSFCRGNGDMITTLTSYDDMRKFFLAQTMLIGHNIICFDIPVVERILGIKIKALLIDTLALSWYLEPTRIRHGLAFWGEDFGVPKPKIDDWDNLPLAEYCHRCEEDVRINTILWQKFSDKLIKLYGTRKKAGKLIRYLSFKMDCARQQEADKWKIDVGKVQVTLDKLEEIGAAKYDALMVAMPLVPTVVKKTRPKHPYKQDGTKSVIGAKWFKLLKDAGYQSDYRGEVEVITGYKEPNPGSHVQVKNWLNDLGWKPETFKYNRDKETGETKKVPQVNSDKDDGVCSSIKKLFKKEPSLEVLDGLSIVRHRITILNGFVRDVDVNGYIKAEIQGLTNTLRFKHTKVVNLPSVFVAYGEEIRGCLIAPDGYELMGSDMVSLENNTKLHYMFPHDPEYVEEQQQPGFCPHLDIAEQAELLTAQQCQDHKDKVEDHSSVRKISKEANYACTYGAKAPTVARGAGVSLAVAQRVVEGYWKRNWSLIKIAEECVTKVVDGQKWLYNPVSELWYSLRHDKDRFSTLNQGTGVWCFDTWIRHVRSKRKQLTAQFHDEGVWCIKKGFRDKAEGLLRGAIDETNKELKLNVKLDIDVQFGDNYAEIH